MSSKQVVYGIRLDHWSRLRPRFNRWIESDAAQATIISTFRFSIFRRTVRETLDRNPVAEYRAAMRARRATPNKKEWLQWP